MRRLAFVGSFAVIAAVAAASCVEEEEIGPPIIIRKPGTVVPDGDGGFVRVLEDGGTVAVPPPPKCGLAEAALCKDGEGCGTDADCVSDFCEANKCGPPNAAAHEDKRRNAGETGVDCGGKVAATQPCPGGAPCKTNDDCVSTCTAKVCDEPGATDGKKNNEETDVDCGGPKAPACPVGKVCAVNADCDLLACTAKKCVVPTSSDGVVNGSETDVDCGGPGVSAGGTTYKAPRCGFEKTCAAATDCLAKGCAPTGKCTLPSCATAETAGIVSCGAKETGEVGAAHDSCCKSLVLPTRTARRLDKYEITAGRYRSFIKAAGPNIRAWVAAYIAANPTSQLALAANASPSIKEIYPAADRFDNLSLTAHLSLDIDNYGGIRGCFNGIGASGANTYWQDAMHLADFLLPPRSLARSFSDEKSLNCAMPIMFAAFCAWDGGEMATLADYLDAWPAAQTFPWGNANLCAGGLPYPSYNWCNGPPNNGGFTCQNTANNLTGELGVFYEWPRMTDRTRDNEPLIGAPGRFVTDKTSILSGGESWYDLFANLAEYTGDFQPQAGTFCDFSAGPVPGKPTCTRAGGDVGTLHTNIPRVGIIGRSWEGHNYAHGSLSGFVSTFQYGKFGARCVRPTPVY